MAPLIHPGEILREELMIPRGLTAAQLARLLKVSSGRIQAVVRQRGNVTADLALRLARCFGMSPEMWLNLQNAYDLERARRKAGKTIAKVRPVRAA